MKTEETKTIWGKKADIKTVLLQELLIVILVALFGYAIYQLIDLIRMAQLYIDDLIILCFIICIIVILSSFGAIIFVLKTHNKKWVELKFKMRKKYIKEEES